jgi:hypothetical protein
MSDMNSWNAKVIDEFRASGGHPEGDFAGAPLLLLHTHGAKTNAERVNPMMYLENGGRYFVFASKPARTRIQIGITISWQTLK